MTPALRTRSSSVLRSARMVLRKLRADDLEALVDLDSDPKVVRFVNGGTPTPRTQYLEEFLPRMLAWEELDPLGFYAAEVDQQFIGWFHLRPSAADGVTPELGYRLRAQVWGRGLATEGALLLRDLAFEQLQAAMVDACTVAENLASIAVMKKCGLAPIGDFVHPRSQVRVQRYALTRAAWRSYSKART